MAADDDVVVGGSSSPAPPPPPPCFHPKLVLDSGATVHKVGDGRLLSNLRAAPAGLLSRSSTHGGTMPITKIGDIDIPGTKGFTIPSVGLVPGFQIDGIVSVHQLARRHGILTLFVGDRAEMYAGQDLVGVAVAPPEKRFGLYVLEYLRVPQPKPAAAAAAAASSGLVLAWCRAPRPKPEPKRFAWGKLSPLRVQRRKQLRLRAHMQQ